MKKRKSVALTVLSLIMGLMLSSLVGCMDVTSTEEVKSSVGQESQVQSQQESLNEEPDPDTESRTDNEPDSPAFTELSPVSVSIDMIPAYTGNAYVEINGNVPYFTEREKTRTDTFEFYSNLDSLGRCGVAYANICKELQPTEERGEIGSVRPSGWKTVKYNDIIDGNYLYNRCHLIGYQLAGENANTKNLITGTRYLNVTGMLPLENTVADYVSATGNHVLYRVTPVFTGNNLVADGVLMEAYSVEDDGKGIQFCRFCYNVQPGIGIDYFNGDSWEETPAVVEKDTSQEETTKTDSPQESSKMVWLSATGSKYHSINNCGRMNPSKARQVTEEEAIAGGFEKCSKCW